MFFRKIEKIKINFQMILKIKNKNYDFGNCRAFCDSSIVNTSKIRIKNVFLTYSQINKEYFTKDFVLKELLKKKEFKKFVIALEEHKEKGGHHIHAIICYSAQLNHPMDFFDLKEPITNINRHPNIKYAKPLIQKVLYIIKEDVNFLSKNINIEKFKILAKDKENILLKVTEIFENEGYDKALDYFHATADLKQKTKYSTKILNNLKSLNTIKNRPLKQKAKFQYEDYYKVFGIETFIDLFEKTTGPGALFVGGATNIGKTNYLETLLDKKNKKWIRVKTFEQLNNYNLNVLDFIIFDDANFEKIKTHEDFLNLFDHLTDAPVPARFKDPVIPIGVGRIFLSNFSFYNILEEKGLTKDFALLRRVFECVIIHYLSPYITKDKKSSAIVYNVQNIYIKDSTINLNANEKLKNVLIPEYKSMEKKILCIDSFATNEERKLLT